jgi:hypothetical protein
MQFYFLAYPKTKPSLIRIHSTYAVFLSHKPSVLFSAASSTTGTLSNSSLTLEQLQLKLHLAIKPRAAFTLLNLQQLVWALQLHSTLWSGPCPNSNLG